jgi:PAS domain S-box-containing protein
MSTKEKLSDKGDPTAGRVPHPLNLEELTTILHNIGNGITIQDSKGYLVYVNDEAAQQSGFATAQDMINSTPEEIMRRFVMFDEKGSPLSPMDLPGRKVLAGDEPPELTIRFRVVATDEERWAIARSFPIHNADGTVRYAVNVFRDITRKYNALQENLRLLLAVEEERRRLDTIIKSVPGVVWEAWGQPNVASQRIDYVSDYVEQMTGYKPEEWISTPNFWLTIVHPEDRERAAAESAAIFQSGGTGTVRFRWVARDGKVIWVDARSTVICDESGTPVGMRGVTMDISTQKETEERIKEALITAEAASHAKDRFLAILSHELRTPLTPVLTLAQVLLEEDLPSDLHDMAEIIHRNAELEARLIDDILDLTQIERGKLQLNLDTVDLHALIENVLEIYRSDINANSIDLIVALDATRRFILADAARIQQSIWNLVKNAVKFTPVGGRLHIQTSNLDNEIIRISVADNGIGIDKEDLPNIFNAFEQGRDWIGRKYGGLGLGLAICHVIVEMHGGTIQALSNGSSTGATFLIDLPTVVPPEKAAAQPDREKNALTGPVHILLVDDHVDTSRVLRLMLERVGYRITTANSCKSALELINTSHFDLMVSDIGLPDGSGLDLMRTIIANGTGLRGIALSGFGMEEDVERSLEAGFSEHLTKPVSFHVLHEAMKRIIITN